MSKHDTRRLDELVIDPSLDPRTEERSQEKIQEYVDNLDLLPPIDIDQNNRILDGIHRYLAHELAGREEIAVKFFTIESNTDAVKHAIQCNATHGIPLTTEEIKQNAIRLWKAGATEKEIAETIKRSEGTVQSYLAEAKQKLKEKQQEEAVELYKDGYSQTQISKIITDNSQRSINQKTVSNYLKDYRKEQVGVLYEQGLTKQDIKNKLKEEFPRNTSDPVDQWLKEYIASKCEPEPQPERNQHVGGETEPNHKDILKMILWIGEMDGLKLWLGKRERRSQFTVDDLAEFPGLLPDLPAQNYHNAREVIEEIDVLWLDAEEHIVAAFEVENSSPIYSGLLRMSDLRQLRESVRLHIVSSHSRRRKAVREINRPTFSKLNLSEACKWIPYDVLIRTYEDTKQNGSISNDWQAVLDEIAQDL